MKNKACTILIADNQIIAVKGLESIIRANMPGIKVKHYITFETALKASETKGKLLIIIDFNISLGINLGLVQKFKELNPKADILIYSNSNELHFALPYIKAGAMGYLSKLADEAEIITALKNVISGCRYISTAVGNLLIDKVAQGEQTKASLSPRELQVAEMLVKGHGVSDISKILNLHMGTISTFKLRVFKKLKVKNLIELAEKI